MEREKENESKGEHSSNQIRGKYKEKSKKFNVSINLDSAYLLIISPQFLSQNKQ